MTPQDFSAWLKDNKQDNPVIQFIFKELKDVDFNVIDQQGLANILNEREILHNLTQNNSSDVNLELITN